MNKTPSTLSLFSQKGTLSLEAKHLLKDQAVLNQYKTILEYAKAHDRSLSKQEILRLRDKIESDLKNGAEEHAFVIFKLFELGTFGNQDDFGFRQSMASWLAEDEIDEYGDPSRSPTFQSRLKEGYSQYNLISATESSVKYRFEQYKPTVVGITFELVYQNRLNRLLQFIGSKLRVYVKQFKKGVSIVLGYATLKKIGIYNISVFTTELIRTPNFSITNAANVLETDIMVRHVSLNTIFDYKWAPIFEDTFYDWRLSSDPYWNISHAIKSEAVNRYRANWNLPVSDLKPNLVNEMEEGIIFHEIGHTVIQDMFLPTESICVGLGTKYYGASFYDALYELLADFAPKHKLGLGAMANLVKIAKTDRAKAERMFYTYLSDIWFFDTDDRDMWPYATIVALCMLRHINPDRSVNFDGINADVSVTKGEKNSGSLIELIKNCFISDTQVISEAVKPLRFLVNGGDYSFQYVLNDRITQWRKRHPGASPEEYTFLQPFWHNMFSFIHHFTTEEPRIKGLVDELVEHSMYKILLFTAGSANAEKYRQTPRQYIVDRCFDLGLVYDPSGTRQIIE